MADHNDPNAVNSIFSDVDASAADVYDMFGFPGPDTSRRDRVVVALTFADVPEAGVLDTDLLYRLRMYSHPRAAILRGEQRDLDTLRRYIDGVRGTYFGAESAMEIRVTVNDRGQATVAFHDFPGGSFSVTMPVGEATEIPTPDGLAVDAFIGGRDDAFFNNLPGFFRSINYAPQFYHVPSTRPDLRELPIPKTLLELEGNDLFNYNPAIPDLGWGVKLDLPPGPYTWTGDSYKKDAAGNYRFVYDGRDARAGQNVNAIILEMPLRFITRQPETDRIVDIWGESWVRKASHKVPAIPDHPIWHEHPLAFLSPSYHEEQLEGYKLVDTVGQPFADAGLSERENNRQLGADNFWLAPHFVKRLAHLGWGFGPSITALGLRCAFDTDGAPVPVHRVYHSAVEAFPRTRNVIFQPLNMPDDSWDVHKLGIPLRRPFEIFVPNVCALDMDTTGTWPFGRRLEDQVANRFLSLFLDMESTGADGSAYHVETLSDQALWDAAPIEPKTSPNPLKNDKDFLPHFPYLAEPW
jgi:hypothetical protein